MGHEFNAIIKQELNSSETSCDKIEKYRVGQENLPVWPTWHKIVRNYLSCGSILIKVLVHVPCDLIYACPKKLFT
jgi:hypothetical protein